MLNRPFSKSAPGYFGTGYRSVACAVIRQAVRDLNSPQECEEALSWLLSSGFAGYAESLGFDPDLFGRRVITLQMTRWREWTSSMARTFRLVRFCDATGVSGTGVVAEGVTFNGGQTVICWTRPPYTISVFPSVEAVLCVHGHNGNTKVVWDERKHKEKNDSHNNRQSKRWSRKNDNGSHSGSRPGNARIPDPAD